MLSVCVYWYVCASEHEAELMDHQSVAVEASSVHLFSFQIADSHICVLSVKPGPVQSSELLFPARLKLANYHTVNCFFLIHTQKENLKK